MCFAVPMQSRKKYILPAAQQHRQMFSLASSPSIMNSDLNLQTLVTSASFFISGQLDDDDDERSLLSSASETGSSTSGDFLDSEVSLFDFEDIGESRRSSFTLAGNASRVFAPQEGEFIVPSLPKARVRVNHVALSNRRLEPSRIARILCQTCSCARFLAGKPCMSHFSYGSISGHRYSRSKLGPTEEYSLRTSDLQAAFAANPLDCRVLVDGKSICMSAYCMIFDYNASSMRRSWSKIKAGNGVQPTGRPKGSFQVSDPIGKNILKQSCYAWLKSWTEVVADEDPVGIKYKLVLNFVRVQDLYQEYKNHFLANSVLIDDTSLSLRRFGDVWEYFKGEEKIRVRRKANTTTKCSGNSQAPDNI
jgi:hypothetical protein